ncbi:hypothetical protein ACJX0J_038674 [Zea mays]
MHAGICISSTESISIDSGTQALQDWGGSVFILESFFKKKENTIQLFVFFFKKIKEDARNYYNILKAFGAIGNELFPNMQFGLWAYEYKLGHIDELGPLGLLQIALCSVVLQIYWSLVIAHERHTRTKHGKLGYTHIHFNPIQSE